MNDHSILTIGKGQIVFLRILVVVLGCVGITWGLFAFPIFQTQSPLERIASHIIRGDPYKREELTNLAPILEKIQMAAECRSGALRSAAIIQLRILESSPDNVGSVSSAGKIAAERDAIIRSLSCSPADPFLWLVLFGLDHNENNLTQRQLDYLRLSYQLGPNEGWISLKRNPIVIGLFQVMPEDLKEAALREFSGIVEISYTQASKILTGPGWPIHDILLARLGGVDERTRKALAKDLYENGYDVSVPGIEQFHSRH
jgi:hypothetical protein